MTSDELRQEGTGAVMDQPDGRDHKYRDLIAAGAVLPVTEADWDRGFVATENAGLKRELRDQAARSSCVAETCCAYGRVLLKLSAGLEEVFAASSLYPFIRQPGGGASLRDGVKGVVAGRLAPKRLLPDEDAAGNPLPEDVVADPKRVTPEIAAAASKLDVFEDYRVVEGGTDDIEVFASAIKNGNGAVLGFTGTNEGWCSCAAIKPPQPGQKRWGHAVFGEAFGKTDVEACGVPAGTKAIFIPGSWGGRYTYTSGRWKGYSAITAEYFLAGEQTAAGYVKGIFVFNAWVILPKSVVPPDLADQEMLRKRDNGLVQQVPGNGAFAIVLKDTRPADQGGTGKWELRTIADERAGIGALTAIKRGSKDAGNIDAETWKRLPQRPL